MRILVSACLLGVACRYDGKSKPHDGVLALQHRYQLIPVCGEVFGGLPTPRTPAERVGNRVCTRDGRDVTVEYVRGAEEVLALAKRMDCTVALLKERSPSCGSGAIYDGTFSATLIPGYGVTAQLLRDHGITVFGESQLAALEAYLAREETL